MTPAQLRLILEAAAVAILLAAFGLYTWHERSVGAEKITAADAKALRAAHEKADAQTALNTERAKRADEGAANAQAAVDAYRAAHPEQPIRLCHPDNRLAGSGQGGTAKPGAPNPSPGPAPIPAVPGGGESEGPDIAPELDAIVQSAGRLAVIYADLQQRQH